MPECRILIADDEALARERLRTLLAGIPDVTVVGEACDGAEAVRMIGDVRPDLVLLDIDMPVLDGFGVIQRVGAEGMPAVVFVTAYDQHAIRAFDANAVDYLLKPVSRERLHVALDRARARLADADAPRLDPRLVAWIQQNAPVPYRDRVTVRNGNHYVVLKTADVVRVEAADNYVRLHVGSASYLLRTRMRDVESTFDPVRFVRIHRSMLINVEAVEKIEPWGLGEYLFVMKDGVKISSSRRYRDAIRDAFGV